ncbi:spondin-1-like [Anticarsia gemmatalis]|uniref:spondin-1-like n=1 Tax=Anticarsia gemmatalis TaxID=129554 RepID=UPI003F76D8DD
MGVNFFGTYQAIILVLLVKLCVCLDDDVCDRRPLDTNAAALPADNRFLIDIKNIRENMYIPKQSYEVRLFSRDNTSTFIAFTISLRGDSKKNKNNARRPIMLKPGLLQLLPGSNNTKYSRTCENTIIQSDITPKTEVKVNWIAPDKDNKCVTIFAVVAVQPDVWYNYEGPLSQQVCEDRRKADDMQPMENDNCDVCEDARYQLTFEGMWSQNTHPMMYPTTPDIARFSDIVGASHSKDFSLYKTNSEATSGLKMLAEQGNTTEFELEIFPSLKQSYVRTIIKASAAPRPNMSTVTNFRVTRVHHLVSVATALLPSPDWFLGVSNLELCDVNTKYWAQNVTLNLYPLDAGTDSGKFFEAANEDTSPPQPITSAVIYKDISKEEIKPFARLLFRLVRTYSMPDCVEQPAGTENPEDNGDGEDGGGGDDGTDPEEEERKPEYRPTYAPPTTTSEEPPSVDPETEVSKCPMTTWTEWSPCEGECIEKAVTGYQTRFRQHFANPTPECTVKMPTEEFQPCEEECEEEEVEEEEYEEEE